MSSVERAFVGVAAGLALVFTLATAHAGEPSAADRETARALLQDGDKAMDGGNAAGALKSYEAAHALLGLPATAMAVARAHVALGQLVQAREVALSVAKIPKPEGEEKDANVQARSEAEKLAGELATRIPSIQVALDAPAGTKVTVELDGVVLPNPSAAERINPGRRKVRVTAPGFKDFEQIVELKEKEAKTIPVKLEPGATVATPDRDGPAKTPPPGDGGRPPADADTSAGPSGLMIAGIVVGSVGVVGLGVGAALGAVTMSELSGAEDDPALCPNKLCTAAGREAVDGAKTKGIVSTVGFAVGGAALATGIVLLIVDATGGPAAPASAWMIGPGPGDVGVGAGLRF